VTHETDESVEQQEQAGQHEVGAQDERQVPGTAAPGQAPEGADASSVAALQAERDEAVDRWKRTAADFDNFRKRAMREREETIAFANERLIADLLPILDDLERALDAAAEHEEVRLEEGVRLVHRSLAGLLERQGIRPIETDGRFDPHVHEALLSQPSEAEEGSVLDVIQKGYRLGDRVVRPARVVVAAEPEPQELDG
jgi:molecular chaperone GrpE